MSFPASLPMAQPARFERAGSVATTASPIPRGSRPEICPLSEWPLHALGVDDAVFQACLDGQDRRAGGSTELLARSYMDTLRCLPGYEPGRRICLSAPGRRPAGEPPHLDARVYIDYFCRDLASVIREFIRSHPHREAVALQVGRELLQSSSAALLAGNYRAAPGYYLVAARVRAAAAGRVGATTPEVRPAAHADGQWQRGLADFYRRHVGGYGARHDHPFTAHLGRGQVIVVGADALALARTYLPAGEPQSHEGPLADSSTGPQEHIDLPAGAIGYWVLHHGRLVDLELKRQGGLAQYRLDKGPWHDNERAPAAARHESQVAALQAAIEDAAAHAAD